MAESKDNTQNQLMKAFKIRRSSDGYFSTGGSKPGFNRTGKVWKLKHHLNHHLGRVDDLSIYADCEVVIFHLTEVKAITMSDWKMSKKYQDSREEPQNEVNSGTPSGANEVEEG